MMQVYKSKIYIADVSVHVYKCKCWRKLNNSIAERLSSLLILWTHALNRSITNYLKSNYSKLEMENGFFLKLHWM